MIYFQFQEGASPSTYAFAIVEQRGGREMLTLRAFLAGDVKELNGNEVEHSARLLKMLAVLKIRESFLWILKVMASCVYFYFYFFQPCTNITLHTGFMWLVQSLAIAI